MNLGQQTNVIVFSITAILYKDILQSGRRAESMISDVKHE